MIRTLGTKRTALTHFVTRNLYLFEEWARPEIEDRYAKRQGLYEINQPVHMKH